MTKKGGLKMQVTNCTGYLPGYKINRLDDKHNRGEQHSFNEIINKQLEYGAKPIWETYKIFTTGGMVFATVVLDTTEANEDWHLPIVHLYNYE
jgi:hypothetical protein